MLFRLEKIFKVTEFDLTYHWISHNHGLWTNWQWTEDYIYSELRSQNHTKCFLTTVEMVCNSNLIACRHFLLSENDICEVVEKTCECGENLASSSCKEKKRIRFGEIWIFSFRFFKSATSSLSINMQLSRKWKKIIVKIQSCRIEFFLKSSILINYHNAAIFWRWGK